MKNLVAIIDAQKTLIATILLSMLLVAYGPMTSITNAQAAMDSQKLQQLKTKASNEIDRRLKNLQETLKSLNVDVHLDKESLSSEITGNAGTGSASVNKDGANANLEVSSELKDKAKAMIQKIIDKLKSMKEKVTESTQLTDMQSLGKSLDSQFGLDQLSNVQGAVTKSIESLTSVFDKLKSTANDLQSQVSKLKECATGLKSGESSVNANANNESANISCGDLNVDSAEVANSAQSQLDNVGTMMTTISSVLASSIALVMTLVSSLTGILGGLGNLSSLGDVSNLSSLGNLGGLLSSFTAITSQLDIASGMSGNAQGLLGNLSSVTSMFNF